MKQIVKEFKEFIMRGNVIDLAVGVIIGGAFQAIVNSLVNDIINPLLSIFLKDIDFSSLTLNILNAKIAYGSLINAIITFLINGIVILRRHLQQRFALTASVRYILMLHAAHTVHHSLKNKIYTV